MPSQDNTSNNKRIAKNTIMLYLRMFLTMIVGLYTSRVVLATLGVEDYGIYGVVGGVISMMSFLNASMAGATSRFLTFELGRGNTERLTKMFSSAMVAHIIIALVVLFIAETVGLWFLCNKLVIPEGRMFAAHVVYQLSIFSTMFGITQVPYNSSIISHEKMDIYAYVEMCSTLLKLLIVYLLMIGNFDKLILYAILTLAVSLFIMMVYRVYCIRKFEECHFHWLWDKEYLKPLLSFSGLDLYGNMTSTVVSQGRTFILNIFFGVAINAAAGIATTVQGVIQGFSGNIIQAIRPQIIKAYSINDINRMQSLMIQGLTFSLILLLIITVPFITEIDFILQLWLGKAPAYAGIFCQLLLIFNLLKIISNFFVIGIHACGKVQCFLYTGTVSMLQIIAMYLLFKFSPLPPQWTFIIMIIWGIIDILLLFYLVKREITQINVYSFFLAILKVTGVIFLSVVPVFLITSQVHSGFVRLIEVGMTYLVCSSVLSYQFLLSKSIKEKVKNKISNSFRICK